MSWSIVILDAVTIACGVVFVWNRVAASTPDISGFIWQQRTSGSGYPVQEEGGAALHSPKIPLRVPA